MIRIDAARCTGCRCCEAACAFHHTGSGGRVLSRIRVVNLYERCEFETPRFFHARAYFIVA